MLRAFLRVKIHRIMIAASGDMDESEMERFTPKIVLMGEGNSIAEVK